MDYNYFSNSVCLFGIILLTVSQNSEAISIKVKTDLIGQNEVNDTKYSSFEVNHQVVNYILFHDMMVPKGRKAKSMISFTDSRWPENTIPYVIDFSSAIDLPKITLAMLDFQTKTCIRFVPRILQKNYIRIFRGEGCYSNIGLINRGVQDVSLGTGCLVHGTIVHTLGHVVGFYHEHNRSDRDDYLTIYWENIQAGQANQFIKASPAEEVIYGPFDLDSIMLYGSREFSKDGYSITMLTKGGLELKEVYDKPGLSAADVLEVKKAYGC